MPWWDLDLPSRAGPKSRSGPTASLAQGTQQATTTATPHAQIVSNRNCQNFLGVLHALLLNFG